MLTRRRKREDENQLVQPCKFARKEKDAKPYHLAVAHGKKLSVYSVSTSWQLFSECLVPAKIFKMVSIRNSDWIAIMYETGQCGFWNMANLAYIQGPTRDVREICQLKDDRILVFVQNCIQVMRLQDNTPQLIQEVQNVMTVCGDLVTVIELENGNLLTVSCSVRTLTPELGLLNIRDRNVHLFVRTGGKLSYYTSTIIYPNDGRRMFRSYSPTCLIELRNKGFAIFNKVCLRVLSPTGKLIYRHLLPSNMPKFKRCMELPNGHIFGRTVTDEFYEWSRDGYKKCDWPWRVLPYILSDGRMEVISGRHVCIYDANHKTSHKGYRTIEVRTQDDREEWVKMLDRFACYALLREIWEIVNDYL